MPRIIVTADRPSDRGDRPVMLTERVSVSDFESDHFQAQLVERLGWAVEDAAAVEQRGHVEDAGDLEPDHLGLELADEVVLPPVAALSGHYR